MPRPFASITNASEYWVPAYAGTTLDVNLHSRDTLRPSFAN
jgi:hypothetical protein